MRARSLPLALACALPLGAQSPVDRLFDENWQERNAAASELLQAETVDVERLLRIASGHVERRLQPPVWHWQREPEVRNWRRHDISLSAVQPGSSCVMPTASIHSVLSATELTKFHPAVPFGTQQLATFIAFPRASKSQRLRLRDALVDDPATAAVFASLWLEAEPANIGPLGVLVRSPKTRHAVAEEVVRRTEATRAILKASGAWQESCILRRLRPEVVGADPQLVDGFTRLFLESPPTGIFHGGTGSDLTHLVLSDMPTDWGVWITALQSEKRRQVSRALSALAYLLEGNPASRRPGVKVRQRLVAALSPHLNHRDDIDRAIACEALGRAADGSGQEAIAQARLLERIDDPAERTRNTAIYALRWLRQAPVGPLTAALRPSTDSWVGWLSLETLLHRGSIDDVSDETLSAFVDGLWVARGLRAFEGVRSARRLKTWIDGDDPLLRCAAIQSSLAQRHGADQVRADQVRAALRAIEKRSTPLHAGDRVVELLTQLPDSIDPGPALITMANAGSRTAAQALLDQPEHAAVARTICRRDLDRTGYFDARMVKAGVLTMTEILDRIEPRSQAGTGYPIDTELNEALWQTDPWPEGADRFFERLEHGPHLIFQLNAIGFLEALARVTRHEAEATAALHRILQSDDQRASAVAWVALAKRALRR